MSLLKSLPPDHDGHRAHRARREAETYNGERAKPWSWRLHLAVIAMIVGLLALEAVALGHFQMDCPAGSVPVSGLLSTSCFPKAP